MLHAVGSTERIEDAILPYLVANDAKLVDGKVVGDPTEGALLVLAHKAGLDVDATRERTTPAGDAALRPDLQADGHLHTDAVRPDGTPVVRCFVKGAAPAVMGRAATALSGSGASRGTPVWPNGPAGHMERMEGEGRRVMAAAVRDLDPASFDPAGDLLAYVPICR